MRLDGSGLARRCSACCHVARVSRPRWSFGFAVSDFQQNPQKEQLWSVNIFASSNDFRGGHTRSIYWLLHPIFARLSTIILVYNYTR